MRAIPSGHNLSSAVGSTGLRRTQVWGHFGEIVQGRLGGRGLVSLLTLSAPGVTAMSARATWRPSRAAPLLSSGSPTAQFAAAALRAGLREVGRRGWGGRLDVETVAPSGGGCGVSTSSLLAALRLAAPSLGPVREAEILLRLEGAVDPLMTPEPERVLWASREGRMLQRLAPPPSLIVVGGHDGPGRRTDPEDEDFADISDLVEKLALACRRNDAASFAAVATISSERNQSRSPKPRFAEMQALGRRFGALGVAVAHTGSAIGLLFGPDQEAAAEIARTAVVEIGLSRPIVFHTRRRPAVI